MSLAIVIVGFCFLLFMGYRIYGRYIANVVEIDDARVTPAHVQADGVDFVPTRRFYLFAQHFSAIAAAGPIAGPIMACMLWGWLPCFVWIAFGVVLIGAVHDFLSLTASVRHKAVSIAHLAKDNLGGKAGIAMMAFIWLALTYVTVAFTDMTAGSFVGVTEELAAASVDFNAGGAVAFAAVMYLTLALIMGMVERFLKPPLWLTTIIFVPLAFFAVWMGTKFSTLLVLDAKTWCLLILAYCFVASLMPVWLLLQPRGYLGGFILYSALGVGIYGMLFGGYEIKQVAVKSFDSVDSMSAMFPFLFVTIACGACSGFHGLVCSGTTAKQIDKESHMTLVGYGAMLCEALVAVIALATIMIWSADDIAGLKPGTIYGKGIGKFLSLIIGKENLHIAITFGAMAFSTFVFDTLDVSTRLSRYLMQELIGQRGRISAILCTLVTIAIPACFLALAESGSYMQFWTLFGASNQLLASLTLLSITVWLYRARKRIAFTLLPMLFVLCISTWALVKFAWFNLVERGDNLLELVNGGIALVLLGLAMFFIITALVKVRGESAQAVEAEGA